MRHLFPAHGFAVAVPVVIGVVNAYQYSRWVAELPGRRRLTEQHVPVVRKALDADGRFADVTVGEHYGDLTIVDLKKQGVIRDDDLRSKNHVTPFDGDRLEGMPVGAMNRANVRNI